LRSYSHAENLRRKAPDPAALEEAWHKVPARLKTDTRVALAAAQCFLALGDCARAHAVIEDSLDVAWNDGLAALYAECEGDFARRIERAEAWLKQQPRDATLFLALGRLCAQQELWGKAQSYLEASLSVEPGYAAHLALGQLNDRLGNAEAANRHYRASLELAVAQLPHPVPRLSPEGHGKS
jgi:HemY protein